MSELTKKAKKPHRVGWNGVVQKVPEPKKAAPSDPIPSAAENEFEARLDKGAMDIARAMLDPVTNKLSLHPYQKEVFDTWFNDLELIVYVLLWGRRAGKTTTLSGIAASELVMRPNTLNIWVTPTYEQGQIPKGCIEHILRAWGQLNERKTTRHNIVCKNGSVMYFRSWLQAENLLGLGPNTIFLDEARLLEAPDFSVVFWPMVLTSKGRIIMASSQSGPRGFFYETQLAGLPGPKKLPGYLTHTVHTESNPLCDEKRMEMFRRQYGKTFERECHCVALDLDEEGYLFKEEILKKGMSKLRPEEYNKEAIVLAIDSSGCLGTTGWMVGQGPQVLNSGAEAFGGFDPLLQKVRELLDEWTPDAVAVDGTSLGGNAFEYMVNNILKEKKLSIPVYPVNFSQGADDMDTFFNWRTEALFALRDAIQDDKFHFDPDDDRAFYVQLQTVRCATDDKNKKKCISKQSQREIHTEDTVDAALIMRDGQRRLGPKKRITKVEVSNRHGYTMSHHRHAVAMKGYIH